MKQITYNGLLLTIDYRKIKNVNLYIKPPRGEVLITAPHGTSESEILAFVKRKFQWIEQKRVLVQKRASGARPLTEQGLLHMKEMIPVYAKKWEAVMGVCAACWTVREMKTRWGSCTVRSGRIRLNARLAAYPDECLEYIMVHELCHLLEPSHNRRFYNYMEHFLPDWRKRKELLNS